MSDPISLNAALEIEFGASARLDLSEEWVTYLVENDLPSSIDGIDDSITYSDDERPTPEEAPDVTSRIAPRQHRQRCP